MSRTLFDPTQHGIFRSFMADDGLHHSAWNRAVELGEHVGTCRTCGGFLLGTPTHQSGRITWFGGRCTRCGHEFAAPNGAALRRSSRHGDMPAGWWDLRAKKQQTK